MEIQKQLLTRSPEEPESFLEEPEPNKKKMSSPGS